MVAAFAAEPGAHLGARLVAGLAAGLAAGGGEGPVRSAGVVVCDRVEWPVVDLRVDWDDDPIARLAEAWAIWEPQIGDYVTRALDPGASLRLRRPRRRPLDAKTGSDPNFPVPWTPRSLQPLMRLWPAMMSALIAVKMPVSEVAFGFE